MRKKGRIKKIGKFLKSAAGKLIDTYLDAMIEVSDRYGEWLDGLGEEKAAYLAEEHGMSKEYAIAKVRERRELYEKSHLDPIVSKDENGFLGTTDFLECPQCGEVYEFYDIYWEHPCIYGYYFRTKEFFEGIAKESGRKEYGRI